MRYDFIREFDWRWVTLELDHLFLYCYRLEFYSFACIKDLKLLANVQ